MDGGEREQLLLVSSVRKRNEIQDAMLHVNLFDPEPQIDSGGKDNIRDPVSAALEAVNDLQAGRAADPDPETAALAEREA